MSQVLILQAMPGAAMLAPVAASAADIPLKAAPRAVAIDPSWSGLYFGVHAGANWQRAQTHGAYTGSGGPNVGSLTVPVTNSLTKTGFIGGGQIGFNFQQGSLVYGLEGDFSSLSGKMAIIQPALDKTVTTTNRINWLATLRGRLGFAVGGNTMIYGTAGVAFGGVKNTYGYVGTLYEDRSTRTGYVAGLGAEHMLNSNWLLQIEGLYVDLGDKTVNCVGCSGGLTTTFANQVLIGRVGLSYKLPY